MNWSKKISLRPGEEIIEIISRHPAIYIWRYVVGLAVLTADAFFMFYLVGQGYWGYLTLAAGMFIGLWIIFTAWLHGRASVLIVTAERAVDVSRAGLFDEVISSVGYGDMRDVYARRRGLFQNILPYGTVTIENKSSQAVIDVVKIPHPARVADLLIERRDIHKHNKRLGNKQAVYENFISLIPYLSEEELCAVGDAVEERLKEFDLADIGGAETADGCEA